MKTKVIYASVISIEQKYTNWLEETNATVICTSVTSMDNNVILIITYKK